jgi:hypothetical protein
MCWRESQPEAASGSDLLYFTADLYSKLEHGKTHGLRNEITTLHESASPGVLFTPLVWWQ